MAPNPPIEVELLKKFSAQNITKEIKVSQMENLVHDFDVQKIIRLNERLQAYYKSVGDDRTLDLLDRMTVVMEELTEIINQVKSKRISLEQ